MQIKLLRILSYLGAGDKTASDNMYAVLWDILRKANTGHTIGNAIVAECVRTITAIYPNPNLLQAGDSHPPLLPGMQNLCQIYLSSTTLTSSTA